MDAREKKILGKLSGRLRAVTKVGWTQGDVSDWSDWAKRMRDTIISSVDVLEGLTEDVPEEKNQAQTEEDFLSKNLEE